jgi:hypothetical protein
MGLQAEMWPLVLGLRSETSSGHRPRSDVCRQDCRCDFAVGDVVIDARGGEPLTRLIDIGLADHAALLEFGDDEIALGIGVGIGGVRDLKGQSRE